MSVVLQSSYRPEIQVGLPGMIYDLGSKEIVSRVVETSTGIPFGVAVSWGANSDRGAVIGGSSFLGISLRDIALPMAHIDPYATTDFAASELDSFPQYANMPVMTRGRIWVRAGATVTRNNGVYFDATTGLFSNSASGAAAFGSITFSQQPVAAQTVTMNGTVVTFGTDVALGPTLGDTIVNLAAFMNASSDTQLVKCSYEASPVSPGGSGEGSGANQLIVAEKTVGTAGNALTLATNVTGATVSGSTLSGGTASATQITSARWFTSAIAGDVAVVSLGIQQ
jgi:hypothetical protein